MRKSIMFAALAIFQFSILSSQIDKPITSGNIILGGSINAEFSNNKIAYNYNANDNPEQLSNSFLIDLSPNLLYFIADHVAVGGLVVAKATWDSDFIFRLGLGPSFSYYADNGLVFGLHSKAYLDFFKDLYETYIEINPFIGYAWFVNSKIALEPRINYNYYIRNFGGYLEGSYIEKNRLFFNVTFSKFF